MSNYQHGQLIHAASLHLISNEDNLLVCVEASVSTRYATFSVPTGTLVEVRFQYW